MRARSCGCLGSASPAPMCVLMGLICPGRGPPTIDRCCRDTEPTFQSIGTLSAVADSGGRARGWVTCAPGPPCTRHQIGSRRESADTSQARIGRPGLRTGARSHVVCTHLAHDVWPQSHGASGHSMMVLCAMVITQPPSPPLLLARRTAPDMAPEVRTHVVAAPPSPRPSPLPLVLAPWCTRRRRSLRAPRSSLLPSLQHAGTSPPRSLRAP